MLVALVLMQEEILEARVLGSLLISDGRNGRGKRDEERGVVMKWR